jgi:hypothetical protein
MLPVQGPLAPLLRVLEIASVNVYLNIPTARRMTDWTYDCQGLFHLGTPRASLLLVHVTHNATLKMIVPVLAKLAAEIDRRPGMFDQLCASETTDPRLVPDDPGHG